LRLVVHSLDDMDSDNRLGEFLRARREPARPEAHGMPAAVANAKLDRLRRDFGGWKELTLSTAYAE
jgi:hypothetical protein